MTPPAMITSPETVASLFEAHKRRNGGHVPLVSTSGGFDPLHIGHLRCIQAASMLKGDNGLFVVIVNGDGFLMRKKGYVFMPQEERLELVAALRGVDYVVAWDDGGQFVTGAIEIIKPNIFAKGGDRSTAENVPEYDTCMKVGCHVVFGIGGHTKVQSSSDLVQKMQQPK
jgi:cytidyltransferase-like protein